MSEEQTASWLKSPEMWKALAWPIFAGFVIGLLNFFGFHLEQGRRYVLGVYVLERSPTSYAYLLDGAVAITNLLRVCLLWLASFWLVLVVFRWFLQLFSDKPVAKIRNFLQARPAAWIGVGLALGLASLARFEVLLGLDYDGLILKPYSAINPSIGFFSGKIPEELSWWFPLSLVLIVSLSWYVLKHSSLSSRVKAVYLIWAIALLLQVMSSYLIILSVYSADDRLPVVSFSNMDKFIDPNATTLLVGKDSKLYAFFTAKSETSKDAFGKDKSNVVKNIVYVKRDEVKWLKVLREQDLFELAFPETMKNRDAPNN